MEESTELEMFAGNFVHRLYEYYSKYNAGNVFNMFEKIPAKDVNNQIRSVGLRHPSIFEGREGVRKRG